MTIDLDAIRQALWDPMDVAAKLGLLDGPRSFKRLANGILVRCFVHGDRTPSLSLTRTTTGVRAKCFGCDLAGDVFSVIAAFHRLDAHADFPRVADLAMEMAGITRDGTYAAPPAPPMPPEPPRLEDATFHRLAGIVELTCPLRRQDDVCSYLAHRGLLDAAHGHLWALPPNTEGLRWVRSAVVQEVGEEAWGISGLSDKHGEWHCPKHRLCLPWRAPDGSVITIQRRLIGDGKPKYVFPPRRPPRYPYGIEDFARLLGPATGIAWVEGALDVLAMRTLARRHNLDRIALGLPGVSAWVQSWAKFAEARVTLVALDADEAGEKHVERMADDLYAAGACWVKRSEPVDAKDWADLTAAGAP